MAITIGLSLQNAMATAAATELSGATLVTYSGAAPANAKAALAGNTILATHSFTGFSATSNGQFTASPIVGVNADATGVPTFGRILVGGVAQVQGSVGLLGSGADIIVTVSPITAGLPVGVTSFTFTMPDS